MKKGKKDKKKPVEVIKPVVLGKDQRPKDPPGK
jgi:hypothetical protein